MLAFTTSKHLNKQLNRSPLLRAWWWMDRLHKVGGVHLLPHIQHWRNTGNIPGSQSPTTVFSQVHKSFWAEEQLQTALAPGTLWRQVVVAWDNCLLCSHGCLCRHKLSFIVQKLNTLEYLFKGSSTACSFWVAGLTMSLDPQMHIHIIVVAQLAETLLPCG